MRNKQKGGVIVFSKLAIEGNKSIEELMNYFLQNSTIGLLTKEGAEGIILHVNLNANIESPFVKLNNDADPFSDDVPVQQLILKINLLNSTRKEVLKKRTIKKEAFDSQIEHEKYVFFKTFNGLESMVPTIFFHTAILKSHHDLKAHADEFFENVKDNKLKDRLKYALHNLDIGFGLCFYEMIDNSQVVYDYIYSNPIDANRTYVKIFAKMIIMLKKGIVHGDHHTSNILLDARSNIQFIDFARSVQVVLRQEIINAIRLIETIKIETQEDTYNLTRAIMECLEFIYNSGYYDGTVIKRFKPEWDIYNYIRETITLDPQKSDLAVKVYELVRAENAKQERMSQFFLSNVIFGPSLIECEAQRRFKNATKEELIESMQISFKDINKMDLPAENLTELEQLSRDELESLYKTNIVENEELKKYTFESCKTTTSVEFSMEFIHECRRKVFESETPKYGGSVAGGGDDDDGDNSYGGAKTKRRKGRKSRKGKKRNKSKTKHRKLVGGGRFDNTVFAMPGIESNYPFEKTPPTYKLNSPFEKTPTNNSNSHIKQSLSVSPIETQDNWISHYYNMDFAKTQETINKCFIQHDFFAGIIIILIKLGVIGNNPPSIILKTEKAKTIINNAIEYYKKLDKILHSLHISSANGTPPVAR